MMDGLFLLCVVWVGVFAIARLMVPAVPAAFGATAFLALLGGQVAALDHAQWWGDVVSGMGALALLAFLADTVRPRRAG